MGNQVAPGLVERVDHLTAATADLGFRMATLLSSTTAFRDALSDRLTDYADLVARWSMEAEDNLAAHRRTVASHGEVLDRIAAAVDGLPAALVAELAADDSDDGPAGADALAAVLAELAALRTEVRSIPPPPEPPELLLPPDVDLTPLADELARLGKEVAELRGVLAEAAADEVADAEETETALSSLVVEVAALREHLGERPAVPPEVTALTEELRALRSELEDGPADDAPAPPGDGLEALQETVAELAFEVRALRRRLAPPTPRTRARRPEPRTE